MKRDTAKRVMDFLGHSVHSEEDAHDQDEEFGQLAVAAGHVTPADIEEGRRELKRLKEDGLDVRLPQVLIRLGKLPPDRFVEIAQQQNGNMRVCMDCETVLDATGHTVEVSLRCLRCGKSLGGEKPAPVDDHHETTVRVWKYRLMREIGRGGMGVVYEAEDRELKRKVALKILREGEADSRLIERLHREAAIAGNLQHPNIVTVHEVGGYKDSKGRGTHFIAMDLVEGTTLAHLLMENKTPRDELIRMWEETARAVDYANARGIIHRDLKPGNILVDENGRVLLTDFGLARAEMFQKQLTKTDAVIGTPQYMSAEQVEGRTRDVDRRTDVYALGIMLYRILAGQVPYFDKKVSTMYQMILEGGAKRPSALRPEVPEDLDIICMKAIERDRDRRYSTAGEMAEDVRRWREGEPISARRSSIMYRFRKKVRRNPWAWTMAGMVMAALVAGSVLLGVIVGKRERADEAGRYAVAAERMYEAGRHAETLVQAEKALALVPDHPVALYLTARLRIRDHQREHGFPTGMDDPLRNQPDGAANRDLLEGILESWSGDPDRALTLLDKVKVDAPGAWEAEFYSGVALYRKKHFAAALTKMSRHRVRDPDLTLPLWTLALIARAEATSDAGEREHFLKQAIASASEIRGPRGRELELRARRLLQP